MAKMRRKDVSVFIILIYIKILIIYMIILTKLLQKSEMRKVIVIELSYKGFS